MLNSARLSGRDVMANDLARYLRQGGADPELAEVMQGGEASEAGEHATGSSPSAKLESLNEYIQEREASDVGTVP